MDSSHMSACFPYVNHECSEITVIQIHDQMDGFCVQNKPPISHIQYIHIIYGNIWFVNGTIPNRDGRSEIHRP